MIAIIIILIGLVAVTSAAVIAVALWSVLFYRERAALSTLLVMKGSV